MNLSTTSILSFEIGSGCNLSTLHDKCPINNRTYYKNYGKLNKDIIVSVIDEAKNLRFNGHISFHYYNEPLLYLSRIQSVMKERPNEKYFLLTNGTLFESEPKDYPYLNDFDRVVISCYDKNKVSKYQEFQEYYPHLELNFGELDERLDIYSQRQENAFGCMRPMFEIPIDYYGNMHLCCMDWNETYKIGNVISQGLTALLESDAYQNVVRSICNNFKDLQTCPDICKNCNLPMVSSKIQKMLVSDN